MAKGTRCFFSVSNMGTVHLPPTPTPPVFLISVPRITLTLGPGKGKVSHACFTYLNPGSLVTFAPFFSTADTKAGVALNPLVAISIAGPNRSFQGRLPYFFHAVSNPLSSPGTPINSPSPGTLVFSTKNQRN